MSKMIFVCVCLVGLTQLGWSQGFVQAKGIPGFLNPKTGTFTTRTQGNGPLQNPDAMPDTLTEYAGTWTVKIAMTVSSTIPSGAAVFCSADLSLVGTDNYYESAVAQASVSKGSGSCTLTMPYAWFLANEPSDSIYVHYSVNIIQGFTVGPATAAESIRETDSTLYGSFSVPANGKLTTTNIVARI